MWERPGDDLHLFLTFWYQNSVKVDDVTLAVFKNYCIWKNKKWNMRIYIYTVYEQNTQTSKVF